MNEPTTHNIRKDDSLLSDGNLSFQPTSIVSGLQAQLPGLDEARWRLVIAAESFARYFDYPAIESAAENVLLDAMVETDLYSRHVTDLIDEPANRESEFIIATEHKKALVRALERKHKGRNLPIHSPVMDLPLGQLSWGGRELPHFLKLGVAVNNFLARAGLVPENLLMRCIIASRYDLILTTGTDYDSMGAVYRPITELDSPGITKWRPDDIMWADPVSDNGKPNLPYMPKAFIHGLMVLALYDRTQMRQITREIWGFKTPSRKIDAVVGLLRPMR